MKRYLISEGYIRLIYTDEITLLEKEVLAPRYSFDIIATDINHARFLCEYLGLGEEDKDWMIFRRDEAVIGNQRPDFDNYMLN